MTISKTAGFRALAACIRANVSVFLVGHPGQAKTATIEAWGAACGAHVETVVGSSRDRTDFQGTMIERDGQVEYSSLGWAVRLNQAKVAWGFFDELTTTEPDTQKAMLRPFNERVVGDCRLGDHVVMIAAGNPPSSSADGYDLLGPVANRFIHIDWPFPKDEWVQGMLEGFDTITYPSIDNLLGVADPEWAATIRGLVVRFLEVTPDLLTPTPPMDPTEAGKAWPSPRSWTNTVKVLCELQAGDVAAQREVLDGGVGKVARIKFQAWSAALDLPSPEQMLSDPDGVGFDRMRPDQSYASLASLQSYLAARGVADDVDLWGLAVDVVVAVAKANRPDVGMGLASWLLRRKPVTAPSPLAMRDAYLELFTMTGAFE